MRRTVKSSNNLLPILPGTPYLTNCSLKKCLHALRESVAKGWELLTFCLKRMAPSDDFSNYLEIFLRKQAPADRKQAMIISLHEVLYSSEPAKAPTAQPVRPSDDVILPKSPSMPNASASGAQAQASQLPRAQSTQRVAPAQNAQIPPPARVDAFIPPPPAAAVDAYLPPPPPPLDLPPPPPAGI